MVKRGPDGSGVWTGDGIGLVATRLAIIDLHERSNQPMQLRRADDGVQRRDLQLPRAARGAAGSRATPFGPRATPRCCCTPGPQWGEGALDRLNGMFAFAIWDEQDRSLSLATDPFGEKPLYVVQTGSDLMFASEVKALAVDPRVRLRSRDDALAAYVSRGAMPIPPDSFFVGVERLPGAHVLRWQEGQRAQAVVLASASGRRSRRIRGRRRGAPRPLEELDRASPAQRRSRGHLAQRRDRLVNGRDAQRRARRRPPAARLHGSLSGLRARRMALRRGGRGGGRRRRAPCGRADGRGGRGGPRAAHPRPGGAGRLAQHLRAMARHEGRARGGRHGDPGRTGR